MSRVPKSPLGDDEIVKPQERHTRLVVDSSLDPALASRRKLPTFQPLEGAGDLATCLSVSWDWLRPPSLQAQGRQGRAGTCHWFPRAGRRT